MTASLEFNALLDRLETLAVRQDVSSRRAIDLLVERDKWHNLHDERVRELLLERTKREQAEGLVVTADVQAATRRVDLRAAEEIRDRLYQAAKAFLEVPPGQSRMRAAARQVLLGIVKARTEAINDEIPF